MDAQQQRKQKQTTLIEHAASHGSYLWSSKDVQNALLWFPSASLGSSSGVDANLNEGQDDTNSDGGTGCEFLRRLLCSPGIHVHRRVKTKRRNGSRQEHRNGESNQAMVGKKRKRDSYEKRNQTSTATKNHNVLSTVLKGYYQMFLPREDVSTAIQNGSSEMQSSSKDSSNSQKDGNGCVTSNKPSEDGETTDETNAEWASHQLQNDLNSIILPRLRTNELYRAALQHSNQGTQSKPVPKGLQMNILIDKYMTHPSTAILRAYTSSLYDRYSILFGEKKVRFIDKLLDLSKENVKIQQVILLFLLEPLRRLYVQQLRLEMSTMTDGQFESVLDQSDNADSSASKLSMFPLLTCNLTWSDISPEKIEEECGRGPMQKIIEFILQSTSVHDNTLDSEECWWYLPSPLLCFVSQLYFPLACGYIRYWIKAALVAHDQLYTLDCNAIGHECEPQSSPLDIDKCGNSFELAMLRIQQFRQTSERLESLTSYMLSAIEEECKATSKSADHFVEGVDDDAIFQQSLAWNAIKRRIET